MMAAWTPTPAPTPKLSIRGDVVFTGDAWKYKVLSERGPARGAVICESVLFPLEDRWVLCISTWMGCPAGCRMCLTGHGLVDRPLRPAEIAGQVPLILERAVADEIITADQVVGVTTAAQGDIGLNYQPGLAATAEIMAMPRVRDVSWSSIGTPQLEALLADGATLPYWPQLYASIHGLGADGDWLIPNRERYPLDTYLAWLARYADTSGRKVVAAWMLAEGINDADSDADALAETLARFGGPDRFEFMALLWNAVPVPDAAWFARPPDETAERFTARMGGHGYDRKIRASKGRIAQAVNPATWEARRTMAACGSLALTPEDLVLIGLPGAAHMDLPAGPVDRRAVLGRGKA
jgi:23S rRNA (adenine2503-C2)-methyltransferase